MSATFTYCDGCDGHNCDADNGCAYPGAARPSPTGEKVEAVAWLTKVLAKYSARSEVLNTNPSAMTNFVEVNSSYIAALVAERDEARQVAEYLFAPEEMQELQSALATAERERDDLATKWQQAIAIGMLHADRATTAESALATTNARVERLEKAMREIRAQDRVTRYRGTEQQFYEDGPCGKIARAALTGGENG